MLAQFFNVAAQTCVWTFTIIYAQDVVGTTPAEAGWWLQASLIIFLISRFVMTYLLGIIKPTFLLLVMAVFGVVCCLVAMFSLNVVGLVAVVAISAALSLMFPTIYGVALQGAYAAAKAAELGLEPRVAMLNLAPGIGSGEQRRDGFLEGMGLRPDSPQLVASTDSEGNRDLGKEQMASILAQHNDITVVYTVNEQAGLGAVDALKEAGADLSRMVVVSIDGGCEATRDAVRPGDIDATAMQFPENMAREGVRSVAQAARGEAAAPTGYLNTGTELITDAPAPGVVSRDVPYGIRNCWG